jgi:hypothetical protein
MTRPAAVAATADELVARIRPLLAGHSPEVQRAAIADLAAIWIAGHRVADDDEQRAWHNELIEMHAKHVRELVELYSGRLAR